MKRDLGDFDPPGANAIQNLRSEVQSCRGCRNRPGVSCEDRLVLIPVFRAVLPVNVGRQGHVPKFLEAGEEVGHVVELEGTFAEFAMPYNLRVQGHGGSFAEQKPFAGAYLSPGAHQALPSWRVQRDLFGKEHLDLAVQEVAHRWIVRAQPLGMQSAATSEQPGGQNPGIIQNEEVARTE